MLRRMLSTAERTMTPVRQQKEEKVIDKGDAIRERPLGCKRKSENSDGRVDCDHVSGLVDAAP
jgi:hypothetical protein